MYPWLKDGLPSASKGIALDWGQYLHRLKYSGKPIPSMVCPLTEEKYFPRTTQSIFGLRAGDQ